MTRMVVASLIVIACGVASPVAQGRGATPIPQTPDTAARPPVNRTPAQPVPPVKLEVADPPAEAPPKEERAGETTEQGRGGGRRGGRGGGTRGGTAGGPRVVRPGPAPLFGPRYWRGPAWGPPAYFTRPYYWDPFWASGAFGWSPFFYAPWSLMWGTVGYWPGPPTTFMTGGVRLKMKPREAQVIVDGYYAGTVNDFDGVFQSLRLAPGGHKIEVRMDGFETATFDVHVQPDRTLTVTQNLTVKP